MFEYLHLQLHFMCTGHGAVHVQESASQDSALQTQFGYVFQSKTHHAQHFFNTRAHWVSVSQFDSESLNNFRQLFALLPHTAAHSVAAVHVGIVPVPVRPKSLNRSIKHLLA